jgi:hypothetical protein
MPEYGRVATTRIEAMGGFCHLPQGLLRGVCLGAFPGPEHFPRWR